MSRTEKSIPTRLGAQATLTTQRAAAPRQRRRLRPSHIANRAKTSAASSVEFDGTRLRGKIRPSRTSPERLSRTTNHNPLGVSTDSVRGCDNATTTPDQIPRSEEHYRSQTTTSLLSK